MNGLPFPDKTELGQAITEQLRRKSRSFFNRLDQAAVEEFVDQVLTACAKDVPTGKSKSLRQCLNELIPGFVNQGLLFSDLRFYATTFRTVLLDKLIDPTPEVRQSLDGWCYDLALLSSMYYSAQRETTINEQQANLELKHHELRALYQTQQETQAMLHQVWIPIVSVYPGVLLVPLVGTIDSNRATELTERLLSWIETDAIQFVILDLTGVHVVDTHIAQALIQMSQAIKLLGAEMAIVGIVPEIAQTIVQLGLNLTAISTYGSLSDGLQYALRKLGRRIILQ